ncbi:hypothetical protein FRB93_010136 [Tulasnella sp. JGI-2019a]|nr:hypothetical protein FRB93_010136 [Tulasnella sp. JGI-2019a]
MRDVPNRSIRICADRGGTFCDVHASYPESSNSDSPRKELVVKLLSKDPNYQDAPTEGIRRVLEAVTGEKIPRGQKLKTDKIDYIRLSTTVATNALLERKGQRHALLITKGFKDLLLIGNQSRPKIFDLNIRRPAPLYSTVLEIDERVTLVGYTSDPQAEDHSVQFDKDGKVIRSYRGPQWDVDVGSLANNSVKRSKVGGEGEPEIVRGLSGEAVQILEKPDPSTILPLLKALHDDEGYTSIAVVLAHSYTYPEHELLLGKIAEMAGFTQISLSSQLLPMIKMVPRGVSSTADAYLTPVLRAYLDGFFEGFDERLRGGGSATQGKESEGAEHNPRVEFMTSDGGLLDLDHFSGLKSILSGPAGGVVGYALTTWDDEEKAPVIGLDIGGTSTDVSRYAGRYETTYETTTAGVTVQSVQLDINTVAAGGGSCLAFQNGLCVAGPGSAGADPGPACYRKNGPLAVTDANLLLGRLLPQTFPKIFGPNEDQGLDAEASRKAFENVKEEMQEYERLHHDDGKRGKAENEGKTLDDLVYGFIEVANETMCRPIRALTEARGFELRKHILASFGGAGGQHACEIAKILGMKRIVIHRHSSILSAYGLSLADRAIEKQEPCSTSISKETLPHLVSRLDALTSTVFWELASQGFGGERAKIERYLNMRWEGTDTALMILGSEKSGASGKTGTAGHAQEDEKEDYETEFKRAYKEEFGFLLEGKKITVDDIKVRGIGKTYASLPATPFQALRNIQSNLRPAPEAKISFHTSVYFAPPARRVEKTPVWPLADLEIGETLNGPAMIIDDTQTIVIVPGAKVIVMEECLLILLDGDVGLTGKPGDAKES